MGSCFSGSPSSKKPYTSYENRFEHNYSQMPPNARSRSVAGPNPFHAINHHNQVQRNYSTSQMVHGDNLAMYSGYPSQHSTPLRSGNRNSFLATALHGQHQGASSGMNVEKNLGAAFAQSYMLAGAVLNQRDEMERQEQEDEQTYRDQLQETIRSAKSQMKTITVIDNCLYIDYKYIAIVPKGMIVKC